MYLFLPFFSCFRFNGSNVITANVSDTSELIIEMNVNVEDFDQDIAVLVEIPNQLQMVFEPENVLSVIVRNTESFQVDLEEGSNRIHLKSFDFGRQLVLTYGIHRKVFVLQNTSLTFDSGFSVEIGRNFIGCISALRINDVFPLKYLEPSKCNVLQKLTLRDTEETTTEYIELTTTLAENLEEIEEFSFMALFWVCALIGLVGLSIYIAVKKYVKRHTGVYVTREDAGEAEALDADTAVLHSKTGHLVEKRQEWFF